MKQFISIFLFALSLSAFGQTADVVTLLDTQHYDEDGQDDRGMIEFDYFKIWAKE